MYRKLGPSFMRSTEMQRSNEVGSILELDDPKTELAFRRSMRTQKRLTFQVGSIIDEEDPETAVEFKRLVRLADLAIDPGLRNQVQSGLKQILAGVDITRVLDRIAVASVPTKRAPIQVGAAGPAVGASRSAGGAMKRARNARQPAKSRRSQAAAKPRDDAETGHEAYPRLKCPTAVLVGTEFELEVGLSPTPEGDEAALDNLPPLTDGPYVVTVQLDAPGFECRTGEFFRQHLQVSEETPYPVHTVHLVARTSADDAPPVIEARYYIGSDRVGHARRRLKVVEAPDDSAGVRLRNPRPREPLDKASDHPVDLRIEITADRTGKALRWTFVALNGDLEGVADRVVETEWGDQPEQFVRDLISDLDAAHQDSIDHLIGTVGKRLWERMPNELESIFKSMKKLGINVPTVLLVSHETLIPWEMALVKNRLNDAPPILGAQVLMGRWTYFVKEPPPLASPTTAIAAKSLAVISGVYKDNPLVHAQAESERLVEKYAGELIDSNQKAVASFFRRNPGHNIIHYSGHAEHSNDSSQRGLLLADDTYYSDAKLGSFTLPGTPLVFINACQAGAAHEVLGNYGGLVDSFLKAGAGALVAPLWSVDDEEAQRMAEAFYEAALPNTPGQAPQHPAAILRERRARFIWNDDISPSTNLMAYQFYGHPQLRFERGAT